MPEAPAARVDPPHTFCDASSARDRLLRPCKSYRGCSLCSLCDPHASPPTFPRVTSSPLSPTHSTRRDRHVTYRCLHLSNFRRWNPAVRPSPPLLGPPPPTLTHTTQHSHTRPARWYPPSWDANRPSRGVRLWAVAPVNESKPIAPKLRPTCKRAPSTLPPTKPPPATIVSK